MRSIFLTLLRKRWYLTIFLIITIFMMNLFIWNETSPYLQQRPYLKQLEHYATDELAEVIYIPKADDTGLILTNTEAEKHSLYKLFQSYFFQTARVPSPSLLTGKKDYLSATHQQKGKSILRAISLNQIENIIFDDYLDTEVISDWLIKGMRQDEQQAFIAQARQSGYDIHIQSLGTTYRQLHDYYINNLLFGLVASGICLLFSVFLIYRLIQTGLMICQSELRVLRIIGLSKKHLIYTMWIGFSLPVIISNILFWIVVSCLGLGILIWDYAYLIALMLLILVSIFAYISYHIKGEVYA